MAGASSSWLSPREECARSLISPPHLGSVPVPAPFAGTTIPPGCSGLPGPGAGEGGSPSAHAAHVTAQAPPSPSLWPHVIAAQQRMDNAECGKKTHRLSMTIHTRGAEGTGWQEPMVPGIHNIKEQQDQKTPELTRYILLSFQGGEAQGSQRSHQRSPAVESGTPLKGSPLVSLVSLPTPAGPLSLGDGPPPRPA